MVAASGIRTLSKVKFEGNYNIMVVAVSLGVGLIPLGVSGFYHKFPDWVQIILNSGITAGSLTAIVLNIVLNELSKPKASVAAPVLPLEIDPDMGEGAE